MKYGVLVLGLGQIGMGYDLGLNSDTCVFTHARAFSRHPSFELIGAIDPVADKRTAFEQKYYAPAYCDVDAALRLQSPHVVIVAGPTSSHCALLKKILDQSHPLAVLCEKPLSDDLQEAKAMVELCEKRGVRLYVNYIRRSDPGVIEIKRRMESGEITGPFKGIVWYAKGFLHNASHFFNLLEYWLGPMSRYAVLSFGEKRGISDSDVDACVWFERGMVNFQALRSEDFTHHGIELFARNGRLHYVNGQDHMHWQGTRPDPDFAGYTVLSCQPELIPTGRFTYQLHVAGQLAEAIAGKDAALCSGEDALQTLASVRKILSGE